MDGLTVLVVAEGLALAQELNLAFRRHGSVTVLGPAFDANAAAEPIVGGVIDVVVVDLERTDDRGDELVRSVRAAGPVPVVGSSSRVDAQTAALVLAAGGSGVLPRGLDARRALEILRLAAAGELALPDSHLTSVVEHLHAVRDSGRTGTLPSLTDRERQVLVLLGAGRTVGEIAIELGISASTVQAHVKGVFAKLGVHSQVEAMRAAWRAGLVPIPASA